jgi:hypothetical protein
MFAYAISRNEHPQIGAHIMSLIQRNLVALAVAIGTSGLIFAITLA